MLGIERKEKGEVRIRPPHRSFYRGFNALNALHRDGVSPYFYLSMPNIGGAQASLSYVTGAHAFKLGFTDQWGSRTTTANDNLSSLVYRFNNGVPNLRGDRLSAETQERPGLDCCDQTQCRETSAPRSSPPLPHDRRPVRGQQQPKGYREQRAPVGYIT